MSSNGAEFQTRCEGFFLPFRVERTQSILFFYDVLLCLSDPAEGSQCMAQLLWMSLLSEGRDNGPYLMRLVTIGKTAKRKKKGKRKKKKQQLWQLEWLLNQSFMQAWHQPYLFLDICQHPSQFRLSRWFFFCYNFRSTLQLHSPWCNSFPLWKCSSILTLLTACNLIKAHVSALIYS